jgi:hypothetical protein
MKSIKTKKKEAANRGGLTMVKTGHPKKYLVIGIVEKSPSMKIVQFVKALAMSLPAITIPDATVNGR